MRTETLRRFNVVHTWTGLIAGCALFIAFFAGALTVFYWELHEWAAHETREVPRDGAPQADALIRAVLAAHPQAATELHLSFAQSPRAIAYWPKEDADEFVMGEMIDGRLAEPDPRRFALPDLVYIIHYSLGLPETWGMYLLGAVCVIYGLALVSGIVIHAPHLLRDLFALRIGKNLKRLWQDAHNVIGVLSLPFHIVFAYTGAMFTILVLLVAGMNSLALDGQADALLDRATTLVAAPERSGTPASMMSVGELIAAAKRQAPTFEPEFLTFHQFGDQAATVEMYGHLPGRFVEQGRVALSAVDGKVLGSAIGDEAHLGIVSTGVLLALHFGSFGGALTQWLYFLLGLAGAFLFYSGNLLWIESRRKRRHPQQPRLHVLTAQLTVGVCIGCCLAIAAMFVANKLPALPFVDPAHWDRVVYSSVFLLSAGYALLRSPSRAATHLLSATAVFAFAIPIVNAVVTGDHLLRTASAGQWAIFGVDCVALCIGAAFAWLATAVRKRAAHGDANSVWSLELQADTPLAAADSTSN